MVDKLLVLMIAMLYTALVDFPLYSHLGGVWWSLAGAYVVHTRQEGGPVPTQWPPSLAKATCKSLKLSSRTRV